MLFLISFNGKIGAQNFQNFETTLTKGEIKYGITQRENGEIWYNRNLVIKQFDELCSNPTIVESKTGNYKILIANKQCHGAYFFAVIDVSTSRIIVQSSLSLETWGIGDIDFVETSNNEEMAFAALASSFSGPSKILQINLKYGTFRYFDCANIYKSGNYNVPHFSLEGLPFEVENDFYQFAEIGEMWNFQTRIHILLKFNRREEKIQIENNEKQFINENLYGQNTSLLKSYLLLKLENFEIDTIMGMDPNPTFDGNYMNNSPYLVNDKMNQLIKGRYIKKEEGGTQNGYRQYIWENYYPTDKSIDYCTDTITFNSGTSGLFTISFPKFRIKYIYDIGILSIDKKNDVYMANCDFIMKNNVFGDFLEDQLHGKSSEIYFQKIIVEYKVIGKDIEIINLEEIKRALLIKHDQFSKFDLEHSKSNLEIINNYEKGGGNYYLLTEGTCQNILKLDFNDEKVKLAGINASGAVEFVEYYLVDKFWERFYSSTDAGSYYNFDEYMNLNFTSESRNCKWTRTYNFAQFEKKGTLKEAIIDSSFFQFYSLFKKSLILKDQKLFESYLKDSKLFLTADYEFVRVVNGEINDYYNTTAFDNMRKVLLKENPVFVDESQVKVGNYLFIKNNRWFFNGYIHF